MESTDVPGMLTADRVVPSAKIIDSMTTRPGTSHGASHYPQRFPGAGIRRIRSTFDTNYRTTIGANPGTGVRGVSSMTAWHL